MRSGLICMLGLLMTGLVWAEGDAERGKSMSTPCSACHGLDGVSVNPLWPNLAGQQELYLANAIKAYRDGARMDVSMQPFVAQLTDQDAEDLAAYYASLTPSP